MRLLRLVTGKPAVDGSVEAAGFEAKPCDLVSLISRVVALAPKPLPGISFAAFPGENVCSDTVEEPSVMRGDDGATRKLDDGILQ